MAVYTHVAEPELRAFIAGYGLGELLEWHGIAEGVENSNYRVDTSAGPFILTIYEKRVEAADLPFFLGLMRHLAERGVPCPQPVAARDGAVLGRLAGKPAAVASFLAGSWPREWDAGHCAAVGPALARLHLAGRGFPLRRANTLAMDGWRGLAERCRARADEVEPGLAELVGDELARLAASWPDALPRGVVHADLFPDNVLFEDGRVTGVIDFYFACDDILAYDLAVCIDAWCFDDGGRLDTGRVRLMVDGYRSVRPLMPEELAALPLLARGAALRFLLTRLFDWLHRVDGALVEPKDPREYLTKLRHLRDDAGALRDL